MPSFRLSEDDGLPIRRSEQACRSASRPGSGSPTTERKALILDRAADYLSENGFPVRTRRLAAAAGISQRLIYYFFPNKSALIDEIYASAIQGPFKADLVRRSLSDRSRPVEDRLRDFYEDYFDTLLTRRWTRLLIYSSFSKQNMAPRYHLRHHPAGCLRRSWRRSPPSAASSCQAEKPIIHEIGWILHGAVSHLAIRRHLFHANLSVPEKLGAGGPDSDLPRRLRDDGRPAPQRVADAEESSEGGEAGVMHRRRADCLFFDRGCRKVVN